MTKGMRHSLEEAFDRLTFHGDRTPESADESAFCRLADYRDGGIFLAHYAGHSEWERHPNGDELVMVVDGDTTLVLLTKGEEVITHLERGELLVVPENTWHRFEAPNGVKIMTVTPQPTDHSVEFPA